MTPLTRTALCAVLTLSLPACDGDKKLSQSKAAEHVVSLVETATGDVQEIKNGLPEGAKHLAKLFEGGAAPNDDLPAVRQARDKARNKVQDRRLATDTFSARAEAGVTVLR